jgi:hypothetical protein
MKEIARPACFPPSRAGGDATQHPALPPLKEWPPDTPRLRGHLRSWVAQPTRKGSSWPALAGGLTSRCIGRKGRRPALGRHLDLAAARRAEHCFGRPLTFVFSQPIALPVSLRRTAGRLISAPIRLLRATIGVVREGVERPIRSPARSRLRLRQKVRRHYSIQQASPVKENPPVSPLAPRSLDPDRLTRPFSSEDVPSPTAGLARPRVPPNNPSSMSRVAPCVPASWHPLATSVICFRLLHEATISAGSVLSGPVR